VTTQLTPLNWICNVTSEPLVRPMPSDPRSTFQQCSPSLTWKKLVTMGMVVPLAVELKSLNDVGLLLTERKASTVARVWCESIQTAWMFQLTTHPRTVDGDTPDPCPRGNDWRGPTLVKPPQKFGSLSSSNPREVWRVSVNA
jgi:hypothetical protein